MEELDRYERKIKEEVKKKGRVDKKYLEGITVDRKYLEYLGDTTLGFVYSGHTIRDKMKEVAEKVEGIKVAYLGPHHRLNLVYEPKLKDEGKKLVKKGFIRMGRTVVPLHRIVEESDR